MDYDPTKCPETAMNMCLRMHDIKPKRALRALVFFLFNDYYDVHDAGLGERMDRRARANNNGESGTTNGHAAREDDANRDASRETEPKALLDLLVPRLEAQCRKDRADLLRALEHENDHWVRSARKELRALEVLREMMENVRQIGARDLLLEGDDDGDDETRETARGFICRD